MGFHDGAEVCELVGLLILHQIYQFVEVKNIGLYRVDGLVILENGFKFYLGAYKERIIKLFPHHGLNITTETNLVQANFLDVTFNLKSGKYWSYRKPNDQPLYVHHHLNRPPAIKKQLALLLADCLSPLSCNCKEFARVIPEYEEAMWRSGHFGELQYTRLP